MVCFDEINGLVLNNVSTPFTQEKTAVFVCLFVCLFVFFSIDSLTTNLFENVHFCSFEFYLQKMVVSQARSDFLTQILYLTAK